MKILEFYGLKMKAIMVMGYSGSGKTLISEWLTDEFKKRHKDVIYVKNIPHDYLSLDIEGKDTDRLYKANATVVVGRSPSRTLIVSNRSYDPLELMEFFSHEDDIVIMEGFHKEFGNDDRFFKILITKDIVNTGKFTSDYCPDFVIYTGTLDIENNDKIMKWPEKSDGILNKIIENCI